MPQAPPKLSQTAQALTVAATMLLHSLALLDLNMFQVSVNHIFCSLSFIRLKCCQFVFPVKIFPQPHEARNMFLLYIYREV